MTEFSSHVENFVSKPRRVGLLLLAAASLSMAGACGFGSNPTEPEVVPARTVDVSAGEPDPMADFKGDIQPSKITLPGLCSDCAGLLDTSRSEDLPIVPVSVSISGIKPPIVGDAGLSKS